MPEFPSVSFSGDREGLFSAEEVKRLMLAECERATRYRYPVTAMRIAIDRLDQLGDLYGFESRFAILSEVTRVIRRNTRESDFLGYKIGGTFHAIFPHTERSAGPALARRLLLDASKLLFDEGAAQVRVSLSIGIAYRDAGTDVVLDELTRQTGAAIELAMARGGGRFEVHVPPESILDSLPNIARDKQDLDRQLEALLDEKMHAFFESMGQTMPDFGGRDREVLALAVEKMEAAHQQMREEHSHQVLQLQRRLNRMSDSLAEAEGHMRRNLANLQVDTGVASIYRSVQGLADIGEDLELKKEMMAKIFEANMELRTPASPQGKKK